MDQKRQIDVDMGTLKKYKIKAKHLLSAIEGSKKMIKQNPRLQKRLFDDGVPLFLQISLFKVPSKVQKQLHRLKLKHSLHKKDADICLIVPDVKTIDTKDHESHVEHYEKLLGKKNVSVKKIMTFHEFRTDYENFELRSSLVELYDCFLVDGRISGKVVHKCGKMFYKKRKIPHPIKLQASNLSKHIDDALKKTQLYIHNKGNSLAVQFGVSNMKTAKLLENLCTIISQLPAHIPGGFLNVSGLLVMSEASTSIPVLSNLENPTNVKLEKPIMPKPKACKNVSGELTTKLNTHVTVTPSGKVKTRTINNKKSIKETTSE